VCLLKILVIDRVFVLTPMKTRFQVTDFNLVAIIQSLHPSPISHRDSKPRINRVCRQIHVARLQNERMSRISIVWRNTTHPDATRYRCHGKLPNSTCHCNVSWWRSHFCTYFVSKIRRVPHGATNSTLHLYKASILSQGFYRGHLAASSRMHSASVSHASSLTWRHGHQSDPPLALIGGVY